MPVLMQDVASRAGVSITTVSHVMNGTRPIAPGTRKRVLQAIRELNYFNNASARLLARGQSDSYGLLISDIENPFFPELIKSFEKCCLDRRMGLMICTTNYDVRQSRSAISRMIESKVRGVAVMTSQLDSTLIHQLKISETPVVFLDSLGPLQLRSNIKIDYSGGALEAVRHLQDLKHRSLGIITGSSNRYSAVRYRDALQNAMEQCGVPPPLVFEGDNTPEMGALSARELMSRSPRPTAILCGNDLSAIGAMGALAEAGYRVPDDVSVVGADDILFSRFSNPPLTTVRIPRDRLGEMAFEALGKIIEMKRNLGSDYLLETHLLVRSSTSPARKLRRTLGD